MRESSLEHRIALVILSILLFAFGVICGVYHITSKIYADAIENGVGKYEIADKYGNTQFRWVKPEIK